jgi:hypothetical protein
MLFDLEDFAYTGWIGYGSGRRYQNDERTIANSGDLEDYATTFRAVRDAHIKAINERFNISIQLLPINKRSVAVQKYFVWMDALRDFHLYNTKYPDGSRKFTSMMGSLRVLPVEGGVTFNEGDLLGITSWSNLSEGEIATLPDVRRLSSDIGEPVKWRTDENGWLNYVPFDQEWLDVHFANFEAVVEAEYELVNASEGLTENFALYVAPVVVPSTKFKHGVSAGQSFNGTIKTTTGFVKFVIGKEEFLLGSTGSTGVNFSIPVGATSKKSGNFISCDAIGSASGDVLEIAIVSPISSIDLKNAKELTKFVATNGTFGSLSLTKNTKLTYLDVRGIETLTSLSLSGLNLLEEVYCQGCSIRTLNLTGATSLVRIEADNNKLSGVNLNGLSSLTYADFGDNSFSPSSRGHLLIDLDLAGSIGGTLIAPLEGRKSDSDAAYASLISKGWTLTSDGVSLLKGFYTNRTIDETYSNSVTINAITSTGYIKIVTNSQEIILGDSAKSVTDENSFFESAYNDISDNNSIFNSIGISGSFSDNQISQFKSGYSVHSCDAQGNVTGDFYYLGLGDFDYIDSSDIDFTKIRQASFLNSNLTTSYISKFSNVNTLYFSGHNRLDGQDIAEIDLSIFPNLRTIGMYYTFINTSKYNTFKGFENANLICFICYGSIINSIDNSHIFDLTSLNELKQFIYSPGHNFGSPLETIKTINVSGLPVLYRIEVSQSNVLDTIDISNCIILDEISIYNIRPYDIQNNSNYPVDLNFKGCTLLSSVVINGCVLPSTLTYSEELINVRSISIESSTGLQTMNYVNFESNNLLRLPERGGFQFRTGGDDLVTINVDGFDGNLYAMVQSENSPNLESVYISNTKLSVLKCYNCSNSTVNGMSFDFGTIGQSNLANLSQVNFGRSKINSLQNLGLSNNQWTQFDLDDTKINPNNTVNLDFSGFNGILINLNYSQINGNLDISNTRVSNLYLDNSKITSVDITNTGDGNSSFALWGQNARELTSIIGANNNPKVWRIDLSNSKVTSLDVSGSTSLNTLYCSSNPLLTTVNVSGCTNMDFLTVNYNTALTSIVTSSSTRFRYFNSNYSTALTSLDFTNISNIFQVECYFCDNLTSITGLSNKTELQGVYAYRTKITDINLAGCTYIRYVHAHLSLFTPSATDALLSTLAPIIRNYGQVIVRENRTSASNSAVQTLLNKGTYVAYAG